MSAGERRLEALYGSAFLLLVLHEIDSAYWHEWDLFGIPGGIQAFLLANVLLLPPFVYGLLRLMRRPRVGAAWGVALGLASVAGFGIHTTFMLVGRPEFRNFASVAVLGGMLLVGVTLVWVSTDVLRSQRTHRG